MFRKGVLIAILWPVCVLAQIAPSVTINELCMNPLDGSGNTQAWYINSLYEDMVYDANSENPDDDMEWIELYNPHPCQPIDISCYILASNMGSGNEGSFVFPAGTVIPPLGHLTIGGGGMGGVDIRLNGAVIGTEFCLGSSDRWYLNNYAGWIGLYDDNQVPVSAVWWLSPGEFWAGSPTANFTAGDTYYDNSVYTSCNCVGGNILLPGIIEINNTHPQVVSFVGSLRDDASDPVNSTMERIIDGDDNWQAAQTPTVSACNDMCRSIHAVRIDITEESCPGLCDGEITVYNNLDLGINHYPAGSSFTIEVNDTDTPQLLKDTWDAPNTIGLPGINNTDSAWSTVTGLCAGNGDVLVTDDYGCEIDAVFDIDSISELEYTIASSDALCNGSIDGQVNISGVQGWDDHFRITENGSATNVNGTTPYSQSHSVSAGNFDIEILRTLPDGRECRWDTTIVIDEPDPLTERNAPTQTLCFGSSDGQVLIDNLGGGTFPMNLEVFDGGGNRIGNQVINTNSDTYSNNGLSAGNYTYTLIDDNNCEQNGAFVISEPADVVHNHATTAALCFGDANGEIDVTGIGGGTPQFRLELEHFDGTNWVNIDDQNLAANNYQNTGLSQGNYRYILTDNNNCQKTQIFTIDEPTELEENHITGATRCHGESNGSIEVNTVVGGTGVKQLTLFNNGGGTINNGALADGSAVFQDATLSAGQYSFLILDENSCSLSVNFTIDEPDPLSADHLVTPVICHGGNTGTISVDNMIGGTGYLTIVLEDDGNNELANQIVHSSADVFNFGTLSQGDYHFTVTDLNLCEIDVPFTVVEPVDFSNNLTPFQAHCNQNDGSIDVVDISGSNGSPYDLTLYDNTWHQIHSAANVSSFTHQIPSLYSGDYNLLVEDGQGCRDTIPVTVLENAVTVPLDTTIANDTCVHAGHITVDYLGSNSVAAYNWTDPDGNLMSESGNSFHPSMAGDYRVEVVDNYGCKNFLTIPFAIIQYDVGIDSTIVHSDCEEFVSPYTGRVDVTPQNGDGPFTYDWDHSPGVTTGSAIDLSSGTYGVTIEDKHGCSGRAVVQVLPQGNLDIELSAIDDTCAGGYGSVWMSADASESNPKNYTYEWYDANGDPVALQSDTYNQLNSGSYKLVVTDGMGCKDSATAYIGDQDDPPFTADAAFGDFGVDLVNTDIPLSINFDDSWGSVVGWTHNGSLIPGSDSESIIINSAVLGDHTFLIDLESVHGCTETLTRILELVDTPKMFVPNAFSCIENRPPSSEADGVYNFYPIFNNKSLFKMETFEGQIFNRWGELVYEYRNADDTWEGRVRSKTGAPVEIETYVCKFRVLDIYDKQHYHVGEVTVIR